MGKLVAVRVAQAIAKNLLTLKKFAPYSHLSSLYEQRASFSYRGRWVTIYVSINIREATENQSQLVSYLEG